MEATEWKEQMQFEDSLKKGIVGVARWTNCGNYFAANAEIIKVNAQSVKAKLINGVYPSYSDGFIITLPRFGNKRWSCNNCFAAAWPERAGREVFMAKIQSRP